MPGNADNPVVQNAQHNLDRLFAGLAHRSGLQKSVGET
jgi:hypothetical protein